MSGIVSRFETGPKSYEAKSNITGGQLVQYADGQPTLPGLSLVEPASAGSKKVAGVAQGDAVSAANRDALINGTGFGGVPMTNFGIPGPQVGVFKRGEVKVKYAANANYGDKLKAAAAGTVTPLLDADDARLYVGTCEQQGGVAANAVGSTWIA